MVGICGNVLVLVTIYSYKWMQTPTNRFLFNIAVSDIFVLVLDMPLSLITLNAGDFIFSQTICNFNAFSVGMSMFTSVHLLMYMR